MRRNMLQTVTEFFIQLASLYAAAVLFRFGLDKVLGINSSIAGFQQIGGHFGLDPTAFRLFVGAQEILVSLALLSAVALFLPARMERLRTLARRAFLLGSTGLVATMGGALLTEAVVRPGQQDWLVYLALRLGAVGLVGAAWAFARFRFGAQERLLMRPKLAATRTISP